MYYLSRKVLIIFNLYICDCMKILFIGSRLFDDVSPYVREKGFKSVVTESNENADNLDLADEVFIGPRGMEFPKRIALDEKVDGIVPLIGIDPPLVDVAGLKEDLFYKIPVASSMVKAVEIASNKSDTKKFFNSIGLNTPESVYIGKDDLEFFEDMIHKNGFDYPVVLKQNAGQGGKDISIAENFDGVKEYFEDFDEALCENFIEGAEISIETVGWKGNHYTFVPVYKGDTSVDGTHPITRVRYGPANIDGLDNDEVRSSALKIADNLNIEGNMDLDFIFDRKSKKLYAIEINTRPSGTRYLTFAITNVNPLHKLVDMVAGDFNTDDIRDEVENHYCAEIPVGIFKGEIPLKTYKEKDYIVHGPVGYQRVTVRADSVDNLIKRVKDITGKDIEIHN